ncbi:unannotated protein [freshwater metagenome]|uniref:Unannotated protein n=1 Tax=freshwater metagenome TaxID=449393 RepID=A0A6J7HPH5_9ZZZZ|nr:hypothetical protein [Actinomycetota bacterium]
MRHRSHLLAAIVSAALAAALLCSGPASAGVYGGDTQQYDAFVLLSRPASVRPKAFIVAVRATCASGELLSLHRTYAMGDFSTVRLRSRGRFSAVRLQRTAWGALRLAITGHIGPRRADGTISATLSGADRCRAGPLRWSAERARGLVYGGVTSQSEPIVIRRKGDRIGHVDVDWHADCTPEGFAHIPDGMTGFALDAAGGFDTTWSATDETGRWDRSFAGDLTPTAGSGSFQVTLTRAASACASPPVHWQVESG